MTEIQLTKTELGEWRDIVRSNMSNGVHVETAARIADAYIVACRERDAARTTEPPGIAEVFFRHWDIGWAVFNPNGEGVESIEPTYEAAVLHVSGTYVDADERGEAEIYPVAYARNGGEEDRLVKLSDADADVLTSVREILDRKVGESWAKLRARVRVPGRTTAQRRLDQLRVTDAAWWAVKQHLAEGYRPACADHDEHDPECKRCQWVTDKLSRGEW